MSFELSRVCGSDVIVTQLNHKVIESDTHIKIAYKLGNPGAYALDIKYKDLSVPLSPFRIEVTVNNDIISYETSDRTKVVTVLRCICIFIYGVR